MPVSKRLQTIVVVIHITLECSMARKKLNIFSNKVSNSELVHKVLQNREGYLPKILHLLWEMHFLMDGSGPIWIFLGTRFKDKYENTEIQKYKTNLKF